MSNHSGTVKFFNNAKGFGFITNDNGDDVFVHINNTNDEITEGDKVSYDVEQCFRFVQACLFLKSYYFSYDV